MQTSNTVDQRLFFPFIMTCLANCSFIIVGVQTSLQREQDRERKISVLRETMERPKRLPFLKITKYTPKEITDILGLVSSI